VPFILKNLGVFEYFTSFESFESFASGDIAKNRLVFVWVLVGAKG
jgi:hypothetical protein